MRDAVERALRPAFVRQFIKFSLVGAGNTVLDLGGYFLFTRAFHFHYLLANSLAWFIAVAFSFMMNKHWTFRSHAATGASQYGRFFIVSLVALGISTGLLHVFIDSFSMPDTVAKVCTILVVVLWNFSLNKFWTFKA